MIGTRDPTVESGRAPDPVRRGWRRPTWAPVHRPTRLPFGFGTLRRSRWGTNLRSLVRRGGPRKSQGLQH